MHALRNPSRTLFFSVTALLLVLAGSSVQAAPPAVPVTAPSAIPDYGGRDSAALAAVGDAAPNPAAQAGRALEALVVVLAGVVGVVYVLKRFGLVKPGESGKPARLIGPNFSPSSKGSETGVSVVSSQTLPGGAMLHVVRVGDKSLLLAATAQTVTSVAEWSSPVPAPASMSDEFEGYLTRADPTSGIAAANARLRSLLSSAEPEEDPS